MRLPARFHLFVHLLPSTLCLLPFIVSAQNEKNDYYQNLNNAPIQIQLAAPAEQKAEAEQRRTVRRPPFIIQQECGYLPRRRRDVPRSKDPNCFDLIRSEADNFYASRCWDEAARLYRAAKSCADADQDERQDMNRRIAECQEQARLEMFEKTKVLVSSARNDIAANRAKDSRALLARYDRSLAFRLADFANQYIATEDNPQCLQAMFDAWYYTPKVQPGEPPLRVPFGYHLADNLGSSAKVRFLGRRGQPARKLYAFSPQAHLLLGWDAKTFKAEPPVSLDTTMNNFDVLPDGRTLLFWSNEAYLFWRSPSETYRLAVPSTGQYAFSPRGDEFLFVDLTQNQISVFDLRDLFSPKGRGKGNATSRAEPRVFLNSLSGDLLDFAYYKGELWLAYRDSVVVLDKSGTGKQWQRDRIYAFESRPPDGFEGETYNAFMKIFPEQSTLLFANDTAAYCYLLPVVADTLDGVARPRPLKSAVGLQATLLNLPQAFAPDADMTAHLSYTDAEESGYSTLNLREAISGKLLYRAYLPSEYYLPMSSAISTDNAWVAMLSDAGALRAWSLTIGPEDKGVPAFTMAATLNTDGSRLLTWQDDGLRVFDADRPDEDELFKLPRPEENAVGMVAGHHWFAYRINGDTIGLANWESGAQLRFASPPAEYGNLIVAFDEQDRRIAFPAPGGNVEVRALPSGQSPRAPVLAEKHFEGTIKKMAFLPGTDELVIVESTVDPVTFTTGEVLARIWNFSDPNPHAQRVVRLHGYNIEYVAVSAQGDYLAFSNGQDIRVFQHDNLLDEVSRIRQDDPNVLLLSLAFAPEGRLLAAGYSNGKTILWDIADGKPVLQLPAPPTTEDFPDRQIAQIAFSEDGRRMRQLTMEYVMFSRDLDPDVIRDQVQTDYRQLIAFQPDEIHQYNLDQALNYPGNFEHLATSGDLPLLRAFFEYYRREAQGSNNIEQVTENCQRAFVLYEKLDETTKAAQRLTLLDMYEDLHWKWLLRGKTDEAARVVVFIDKNFGKPPVATLAAAHTALLQDNLSLAGRLYADWVLRSTNYAANSFDGEIVYAKLESRFRQLVEYDLLDASQQQFLCGMFAGLPVMKTSVCSDPAQAATPPFDAETRLRWNIFKQLDAASRELNHARKSASLKAALDDARVLAREKPAAYQPLANSIVVRLAEALYDWGRFEHDNVEGRKHYVEAVALLERINGNGQGSQYSLSVEASCLMALGSATFYAGQHAESVRYVEQGLHLAEQTIAHTPDTLQRTTYRDALLGPLYLLQGMARLHLGRPEAARTSFEQAERAYSYGILNIYYGHVELAQGNDSAAMVAYSSIGTEADLASAVYQIRSLGRQFPARRVMFDRFAGQLRARSLSNLAAVDTAEVNFRQARYEYEEFEAQEKWDSAAARSVAMIQSAQSALNRPHLSNANEWKESLLTAYLAASYFLLLRHQGRDTADIAQTLRYAEAGEQFSDKEVPNSRNRDLLKTNMAHALLLRNRPGDRARAIETYRAFLQSYLPGEDPWDYLAKDFRDFAREGVPMPDLEGLVREIKPEGRLEDWRLDRPGDKG